MKKSIVYLLIFLIVQLPIYSYALDVIPGGEGFAISSRMSYGNSTNPTICIVNTLTPGTARSSSTRNGWPVQVGGLGPLAEWNQANKIILFEVSGTIDLSSWEELTIDYPYTAIYGQTAPSPGIQIIGAPVQIKTHDVIIQHVRIRAGDYGWCASRDCDSLQIADAPVENDVYNIIVDHCSIGFSIDENVDMFTRNLHNIDITNCIISHGLRDSVHSEGMHSDGLIIGNYNTIQNIFIARNIFAHNNARNPMMREYNNQVVILNNIIYGWGGEGDSINANEIDIRAGAGIRFNAYNGNPDGNTAAIIGNYFRESADSYADSRQIYCYYLGNIGQSDSSPEIYLDPYNYYYDESPNIPADEWDYIYLNASGETNCRDDTEPSWSTSFTRWSGANVISNMVTNASPDHTFETVGAWPSARDTLDTQTISDIQNGTGGLVDTATFPTITANGPTALNIPSNPHGDDDTDGYSNLEEWIHSITSQVEGSDTTAPTISGAGPSGTLTCTEDPRDVQMSWSTDEVCNCRISTTNQDYDLMSADSVTNTDSTSHSDTESLACDDTYTRYVGCEDASGNESDIATITFSIGQGEPPPPIQGAGSIAGSSASGGSCE